MGVTLKMLSRMGYFTGLSKEELKEVRRCIGEKHIEKGTTFLLEDDDYSSMYLISSGSVKVFKSSVNGKQQILNIASIGESLNDVALFDGGKCAVNMQAMTAVRLYVVSREDIKRFFLEIPGVALNAARVLAGKVRRDASLVQVLSFDQVISRLAKLILKHIATSGEDHLPLFTQQDLAGMVGSSRVFVNKSLRLMEEQGAIKLERRRIFIVSEPALKKLIQ